MSSFSELRSWSHYPRGLKQEMSSDLRTLGQVSNPFEPCACICVFSVFALSYAGSSPISAKGVLPAVCKIRRSILILNKKRPGETIRERKKKCVSKGHLLKVKVWTPKLSVCEHIRLQQLTIEAARSDRVEKQRQRREAGRIRYIWPLTWGASRQHQWQGILVCRSTTVDRQDKAGCHEACNCDVIHKSHAQQQNYCNPGSSVALSI
jgi:hypothetical protein